MTTDLDHKFELAIDLRNMEVANAVLFEQDAAQSAVFGAAQNDSTEYQSKWRRLGDLALGNGKLDLAEECAKKSADLSGLLLLYSSSGNKAGMEALAVTARKAGRLNVSFVAYFLTGQVEEAIDLLIEANRIPEAAFMARTYMPSQISRVLALWKADLKTINEKAAEALADPDRYPNLFPDLQWALKVEATFLANRHNHLPAASYPEAKGDIDLDLIAIFKEQSALGIDLSAAAAAAPVAAAPSKDSNESGSPRGASAASCPAPPSSTPVTARMDSHDEADSAPAAPPSPAKIASPISKPAAAAPAPASPPKAAPAPAAASEEVDEDFDKLMAEEEKAPAAAAPAEEEEEDFDLDAIDNAEAEAAKGNNNDDDIDLEEEENW